MDFAIGLAIGLTAAGLILSKRKVPVPVPNEPPKASEPEPLARVEHKLESVARKPFVFDEDLAILPSKSKWWKDTLKQNEDKKTTKLSIVVNGEHMTFCIRKDRPEKSVDLYVGSNIHIALTFFEPHNLCAFVSKGYVQSFSIGDGVGSLLIGRRNYTRVIWKSIHGPSTDLDCEEDSLKFLGSKLKISKFKANLMCRAARGPFTRWPATGDVHNDRPCHVCGNHNRVLGRMSCKCEDDDFQACFQCGNLISDCPVFRNHASFFLVSGNH